MVENMSRRRALAVITAGAASAPAATLPAAAAGVQSPDAELIRLAAEIDRIGGRRRTLHDAQNRAYDEYKRIAPKIPAALRWRPSDPVTQSRCLFDIDDDGVRYGVCDFTAINSERNRTFKRYRFIGTDADCVAMGLPPGEPAPFPVVGLRHLWEAVPDARRNERMAELVEAMDRYSADDLAATAASGLDKIEAAIDAVLDEQGAVFAAMLTIEPQTLDGFRALARALVVSCLTGLIEEEPDTQLGCDQSGINRLLAWLSGVPITAAARAA